MIARKTTKNNHVQRIIDHKATTNNHKKVKTNKKATNNNEKQLHEVQKVYAYGRLLQDRLTAGKLPR